MSSAIPHGMSFSRFMDKLKSGELALLTDTPSKPVMLRDGMSKSWSLSAEGQEALSPEAKNAFLSRAKMSGGVAGGSAPSRSSAGYASNIDETYVPESVKPDISDAPPKLKYEYCFEVAGRRSLQNMVLNTSLIPPLMSRKNCLRKWRTAQWVSVYLKVCRLSR